MSRTQHAPSKLCALNNDERLITRFYVTPVVSMATISHLVKVAHCLAVIANIAPPVIVSVSLLTVCHTRTVVHCVDHT